MALNSTLSIHSLTLFPHSIHLSKSQERLSLICFYSKAGRRLGNRTAKRLHESTAT